LRKILVNGGTVPEEEWDYEEGVSAFPSSVPEERFKNLGRTASQFNRVDLGGMEE